MSHDLLDDMDDPLKKQEALDHDRIFFGKHKGKTPAQIADADEQYVVWAYENTTFSNRPVFCSEALYRSCGGRWKSKKAQEDAKKAAEAALQRTSRPASGFDMDDMDDDIPF